MSHIEEARKSTQLVVKLLVTRFGSQEEVFGHLTDALRHIGEAEAEFARMTEQPEAVAAVEVAEEDATVADGVPAVDVGTTGTVDIPMGETRILGDAGPQPETEMAGPEPKPQRPARRKRGKHE